MKTKYRVYEMRTSEIDRNGDPCQVFSDSGMAKELLAHREGFCKKCGGKSHYEVVRIIFTDDTDESPYYGVLDTSKNRLV